MLRHSSPIETVLTYATFFAISLAVHMVVILGSRPDPEPRPRPRPRHSHPNATPRRGVWNRTSVSSIPPPPELPCG